MKKFTKFFVVILTVFTAIFSASFANKNAVSAASNNKKKVLVVYFSRTKGVYGGNLKQGNTARVAKYIQQHTDADIYEIVPKKNYPNDYEKTTEVAQKEQETDARPAIKGKLPNVKKYDAIFIGAPIWWGEYPMIVRTFLDEAKGLNGKNLIPFTTHEGSGLGNTSEQLRQQFPKAKVQRGFSVNGDKVKNDPKAVKKQVDSWLNKLNY